MPSYVDFDSRRLSVPPYSLAILSLSATEDEVRVGFRITLEPTYPTIEATLCWIGGRLMGGIGAPMGCYQDIIKATDTEVILEWYVKRSEFDVPAGKTRVDLACYPQPSPVLPALRVSADLTVPARSAKPSPRLPFGGFVRTMFNTPPESISTADVEAFHEAEINAITTGVFQNPADTGHTQDQWIDNSLARLKNVLEWCHANGFFLVGTGDDFLRTEAERQWMDGAAWAEWATKETAKALRESGLCVCLEVVDEANGIGTPDSHPGTKKFIQWWREASGPPLGWPCDWRATYPTEWERSKASDYQSRYKGFWEYRNGRPENSATLPQWADATELAATKLYRSRPWLCQVSCTGAYYQAGPNPTGEYRPGVDILQQGPVGALDVVAQTWLAVLHGAAGVRLYAFDWPEWVNQRKAGTTGGAEILQTGARPGDSRWPGVAVALKSVAMRDAILSSGGWTPPMARGGSVLGLIGPMAVSVNVLDVPQYNPAKGTLITPDGEAAFNGGDVPPGGVLIVGGGA